MAAITQNPQKNNLLKRFFLLDTSGSKGTGRRLPLWRQILLQLLCLAILAEVMFPLMYIITMSLSSSSERPSALHLFPTEFSLTAYKQVLDRPTANPVSFLVLLRNSFVLSFTVGLIALGIAVSASYAFSRFHFKMRQVLMILIFIPLLMPGVGLATPLFLLMNSFRFFNCGGGVMALAPFTSCAA
jgi:arabinogalactan oligomer / maltooligosaccharide transport system permease protein